MLTHSCFLTIFSQIALDLSSFEKEKGVIFTVSLKVSVSNADIFPSSASCSQQHSCRLISLHFPQPVLSMTPVYVSHLTI